MMNGKKNLVPGSRVAIQFLRLLGVDSVRRIDDVSLNDQFAHIVKIAGDGDTFDLFLAPAHFARDDFTVLPYPFGMTLRVLVFDIDGGGKSAHRVAIDGTQVFVVPAILFGSLFDLFQ